MKKGLYYFYMVMEEHEKHLCGRRYLLLYDRKEKLW